MTVPEQMLYDASQMKPWWIWRLHPHPPIRITTTKEQYIGKRKRVFTDDVVLSLPLPYVREQNSFFRDPTITVMPREIRGSGAPQIRWENERRQWNTAKHIIKDWVASTFENVAPSAYHVGHDGWTGRTAPADGFGSMFCIVKLDVYTKPEESRRAQRRDFLVTPPIYMFCDLSSTFAFEEIGPTTFWVQPQVYEATGEISQGSPVGEFSRTRERAWGQRGTRWSVTNRELQEAMDGYGSMTGANNNKTQQQAAGIVRIALDAFLELGKPDPRFVDPDKVYAMSEREPF